VIWPLIRRKLPGAKMEVYGAYTSQKVEQLHKPAEGFFICGRAENSLEVIGKARVLLAPLRFGAGIKGKLTDAMLAGTPSVTSSIGAEGMCGFMEWNGIVSDEPGDFAEAAIELYSNEACWKKAQKNGTKIIREFYSVKEHSEKLLNRISFVREHLQKHRIRNFYGSMLMHHTLASTKYMSKWIEEKGKG
jgi:glycosyltransferase involved in cell wall biosynthesis